MQTNKPIRACFISDGTGVGAETFGSTLLTQFKLTISKQETLPFIKTHWGFLKVIEQLKSWQSTDEVLVFSTLADPLMRSQALKSSKELGIYWVDLFDQMLPTLEQKLEQKACPIIGVRHQEQKEARIEAIDYALAFDDGQRENLESCDILLLGLSRSGKTPTSLWLALHYGLKAANYPITPDDFEKGELPESVKKNLHKSVLLIQSAERLSKIRQERYKNSTYASLEQCQKELNALVGLTDLAGVPKVDVSNKSVEEIAAHALMQTSIAPKGRF